MTTATRRFATALYLAGLPLVGIATAQPATVRPFTVGVLSAANGSSAIEVIARFTGTSWVNTWKGSGEQSVPVIPLETIPDAWLGKPVPRDWTAWSRDGRTSRAHVTGTARADSCEGPTLLAVTLPGGTPPASRDVAIDTDQPVERFREVDRRDPEFAAMAPIALTAFRAHAPQAVAEFRGDANLPLSALSRDAMAGQAPALVHLTRPAPGTPARYYFETFQPARKDPSYGIRVTGWMRRVADGQWSTVGVEGDVMTSDSTPIPRISPLGLFRLPGHTYYLIVLNGYEGWSTGIFEIDANGRRDVLITPGGGC